MFNYCLSYVLNLQTIGTLGVGLSNLPWLSLSILFPIGCAFVVPFFPDKGEGKEVRWFALIVALITTLTQHSQDLMLILH